MSEYVRQLTLNHAYTLGEGTAPRWPVMVAVPGEELKPVESIRLDWEHKVLIITTE